jgi:hypothetical protein
LPPSSRRQFYKPFRRFSQNNIRTLNDRHTQQPKHFAAASENIRALATAAA